MLLNGTTLVYYRAYTLSAKSNDKQRLELLLSGVPTMIFGEKCVQESQTSTNFGFTLLNSYRFLYFSNDWKPGKISPLRFRKGYFFMFLQLLARKKVT